MHFPSDLSEKCWCFCNNCFNLVCSCIQSSNFPKLAALNLQEPKFIEPQIFKKNIMSCSMLIITWKATTCLRYYLRKNSLKCQCVWSLNWSIELSQLNKSWLTKQFCSFCVFDVLSDNGCQQHFSFCIWTKLRQFHSKVVNTCV